MSRGLLVEDAERLAPSDAGRRWFEALDIDVGALKQARRPMCRACLDWSVRRSHLGGSLGAALLETLVARGWARRQRNSRVLAFTPQGRLAFARLVAD